MGSRVQSGVEIPSTGVQGLEKKAPCPALHNPGSTAWVLGHTIEDQDDAGFFHKQSWVLSQAELGPFWDPGSDK